MVGVFALGVIDDRRTSMFGFDFGAVTCENTVASPERQELPHPEQGWRGVGGLLGGRDI